MQRGDYKQAKNNTKIEVYLFTQKTRKEGEGKKGKKGKRVSVSKNHL